MVSEWTSLATNDVPEQRNQRVGALATRLRACLRCRKYGEHTEEQADAMVWTVRLEPRHEAKNHRKYILGLFWVLQKLRDQLYTLCSIGKRTVKDFTLMYEAMFCNGTKL